MNPDETPTPPAGHSPSSGARSNLKNRWKPGLHRGSAPVQLHSGADVRPSPALGEVTDLSTARESLSGQHARGYEQTAPSHPGLVRQSHLKPVEATPAPTATVPSSSRNEPHPQERESRARDHERLSQNREHPSSRRESRSHHRESRPENRPDISESPSTLAPDREPRPQQHGREAASKEYIALKPDPANDPAPRRQRTDLPRPPMPIRDYFPSTRNRGADKSTPEKSGQQSKRRDRDSTLPTEKRAHATISAHVSSSRDEKLKAKPKSRGILGFLKRALGMTAESFDGNDSPRSEPSSRHSSHGASSSGRDSSSAEPRHSESRHKHRRRHSSQSSHRSHDGNR